MKGYAVVVRSNALYRHMHGSYTAHRCERGISAVILLLVHIPVLYTGIA